MEVSPRHTEVSWGAVTYGASVNISVSELDLLHQIQGESYSSISKTIPFSGSDNENTPDWYAEFTNCYDDDDVWMAGKVTVTFHHANSRIYILEGEAVLSFGETSLTYKSNPNFVETGSEAVCTIPEFTFPTDTFRISFKVKYMKELVDSNARRCLTPSRSVEDDADFHAAFENLFVSGKNSDISFVIGDQCVPAHKAILIARAPYFDKMLSSGMKEAETGLVKLEESVDVAAFKEVLKYIYGGQLPTTLDEDAVQILPLADKYDLKRLKDACFYHMEKSLSKENVADTLILADLYRGEKLKKKCLSSLRLWGSSLDSDMLEMLKEYPQLMVEFIQSV